MSAPLPVIVLGAGGHAKVVINALKASGAEILGITDTDQGTHGETVLGVPVLGGDDKVSKHRPGDILLVNGVGSTHVSDHRANLFARFKVAGYAFHTIVHPTAIIGAETEIKEGAQVMAGAVIQPGSRIGDNTVINTGALVDHDCRIGKHVHIAPGVVLSGGICIGDGCHIGAGATLIQNIDIGIGTLVAAGAVGVSNVLASGRGAGAPAQDMDEGI